MGFNSLYNSTKDIVHAMRETDKLVAKLRNKKRNKKVHDYVNKGLKGKVE